MNTLPQTTNPQQWAAVFAQFAQHFAQTGERAAYFRSLMRALTPPNARIVELGAGSNPLFDRATFPNYRNIDYYSDTEIIAHFRNDYKDDVASMQFAPVDYVCKDGKYAQAVGADQTVDLFCSSHSIEHQHCLIRFFRECEALIGNQGMVALLVPHKEVTFDALRTPSQTIDAIEAYHGNYAGASPRNLFDALSHSIGQNLSRKLMRSEPISFDQSLRTAYQAYLDARAGTRPFQDFHNWVFTSESLKLMVLELYQLGLIGMLPVYVSAPVGNEFFCVLAKAEQPNADVSDAILEVLKQIHLSE